MPLKRSLRDSSNFIASHLNMNLALSPLEADAEGRVIEAFTPDFYLPEQDLYIELTTMKQSLVTRKNRKVRKLRRLYPEVNIRIFYQRDFYNLLAKYGLLAGELVTNE